MLAKYNFSCGVNGTKLAVATGFRGQENTNHTIISLPWPLEDFSPGLPT